MFRKLASFDFEKSNFAIFFRKIARKKFAGFDLAKPNLASFQKTSKVDLAIINLENLFKTIRKPCDFL